MCLVPYCVSESWIKTDFTNSDLQLHLWNSLNAAKSTGGFKNETHYFSHSTLLSPTKNEDIIGQVKYGFPFRVYLEHCRSFKIISNNFVFVKSIGQNISHLFYFSNLSLTTLQYNQLHASSVFCVKYDISYECSRDRSLENIWNILCCLLTLQPHRVITGHWKKLKTLSSV